MRFVFLAWREVANPQAGGSELVVDRLACGLRSLGHDVALISGGPVGAREYPVYNSGGRFGQYARAPLVYWRHCRDADVVVDVSNGIPFFAPLWQPKPVLCWVHHIHRQQWAQHFSPVVARFGWFVERSMVPRLYAKSLFVVESSSTGTGLVELGVSEQAIRRVTLGIDRPLVEGVPVRACLFVAVGRLVPHKRIDLLLDAWARVRPEVGGRLIIAGDGPELARLRHRADATTEIRGSMSEEDKQRLLAEAWLLVHSSENEGWGMVFIEAAMFGTPALAFDVAGVRDAVLNRETGVLVQDSDEFVQPVDRARAG